MRLENLGGSPGSGSNVNRLDSWLTAHAGHALCLSECLALGRLVALARLEIRYRPGGAQDPPEFPGHECPRVSLRPAAGAAAAVGPVMAAVSVFAYRRGCAGTYMGCDVVTPFWIMAAACGFLVFCSAVFAQQLWRADMSRRLKLVRRGTLARPAGREAAR